MISNALSDQSVERKSPYGMRQNDGGTTRARRTTLFRQKHRYKRCYVSLFLPQGSGRGYQRDRALIKIQRDAQHVKGRAAQINFTKEQSCSTKTKHHFPQQAPLVCVGLTFSVDLPRRFQNILSEVACFFRWSQATMDGPYRTLDCLLQRGSGAQRSCSTLASSRYNLADLYPAGGENAVSKVTTKGVRGNGCRLAASHVSTQNGLSASLISIEACA